MATSWRWRSELLIFSPRLFLTQLCRYSNVNTIIGIYLRLSRLLSTSVSISHCLPYLSRHISLYTSYSPRLSLSLSLHLSLATSVYTSLSLQLSLYTSLSFYTPLSRAIPFSLWIAKKLYTSILAYMNINAIWKPLI